LVLQVGSSSDLLAERNAQIGVDESSLYPAFCITGTIGCQAKNLAKLWFDSRSFTGTIGARLSVEHPELRSNPE
jgi:outer membrane protein TolC